MNARRGRRKPGEAGRIRVIAGTLKGRSIPVPPSILLRPTGNKVREAVFDILQARVSLDGCRFLDCCAGTGAIGIEALSRGASFVEFVESDPALARALERILADLGLADRAIVTAGSTPRSRDCDIAYLDPPYAIELPPLAVCAATLRQGGILLHESGDREPRPAPPAIFARSYHYGRTHLHLHVRPLETSSS